MPTFSYQARDATGRLVAGMLEAPDERAVAASLNHLGYQPLKIWSPGLLGGWLARWASRQSRVDRQEVLVLLRQLSALLKAGIPLAASLEAAIQQADSPALRQVLADVAQRVQGGAGLSEALGHHPTVFPSLFLSMIRVGETAGILDQVLAQLAQIGTQELETRSRILSALIYPLVLVGFALVVVNGLLIGVLPKFVAVFQASQVMLPWPTRILLGLSHLVQQFWWLLALIAVGAGWWLKRYYGTPEGRWRTDQRLLNLPIVGGLYRKIIVARLSRSLGAMLKTGVPLLEALSVGEQTVANAVFQHVLQQTRASVAEGKALTESWSASGLFPPLVLQMVAVGERSGQLDTMLLEVAAFYDPEIDLTVRNLTTLLEPALLMGMGLMVGFIALSVLLPIFQLIHVFRR